MLTISLKVGEKVTVTANPQDVANQPGAPVFNGPLYVNNSPAIIGLSVNPGVFADSVEVLGLTVGNATFTIKGNTTAPGGALITEDVSVVVAPGYLHHFAPTASSPILA